MAKNKKRGVGALIFALVLLINPNIHTIDILPDFIAYFIIAKALGYAALRAPYFEEARGAFLKLGFLSLAKLPSFVIITSVRSGNVSDGDISALFAISFAAIEIWLSVVAIRNLFAAFYYLGERSDASSLLSPFAVSKRGRTMTPEGLESLSVAFAVTKCLGYLLPELLLLSKAVLVGSTQKVFNPARVYPYALILSLTVVLIFGIIFARRFSRYIRAIFAEGKFKSSLDLMCDEDKLTPLKMKLKVRDIRFSLTLIILAAFLSVDIRFENLYSVNLLPRVLFVLLLSYGATRICAHVEGGVRAVKISGCAAAILSLVAWVADTLFLTAYGYEGIAASMSVRMLYIPITVLYFSEAIVTVVLLLSVASLMKRFILTNTGILPTSDRYSIADRDYHRVLTRNIYIWFGFGTASAVSKALESLFRAFSRTKISGIVDDSSWFGEDVTGMLTVGLVPWFGVVLFALSALFIGYTLYLFRLLGDEAELKYI